VILGQTSEEKSMSLKSIITKAIVASGVPPKVALDMVSTFYETAYMHGFQHGQNREGKNVGVEFCRPSVEALLEDNP
jgi:hypothetical protein